MATIVGTVYLSGCNYQVGYDLLGQNTAGNYSTVRFYGILNVTGTYVSWSRGTASVWGVSAGLATRYNRGSYTVVTQDVNIGHDNQGNYSGTISGSLSTTFVSGTASGGFSLPSIPRQANVTGATDFTDEQNPRITFSNPGGFRINARLEFGGTNIRRDNIPNTGSYTFNLTDSVRNLLRSITPNSNTMTVREVIATCIGGTTENYWSWQDKKMTIVNANPNFSTFDFEDINPKTIALTGDNQVNINGYSNIKVTIPVENKAIAKKSATMNKYRLSIGTSTTDILYSDTKDVSGTINSATSGTYNLYATDSRNNSTLVTKLAKKVIDYTPVNVNSVNATATRDSNGVGKKCTVSFDGTFWNGDFGAITNHLENITYRFKKTTDNTWVTGTSNITVTVDKNKFSFSGKIQSNNDNPDEWDLESAYNIEITISDTLSSSILNLVLNSGIPTIALAKNGVGIMGKYDDNIGGLLQVGGNIIDSGKLSWINPNPTNTIDTMEITIDDEYDTYAIIWKQTTNSEYYFNTGQILKGYGTILIIPNNHYRTIDSSYNGIKINAAVDESRYCIPLYIITYKMNLLRDISNTINIEEE